MTDAVPAALEAPLKDFSESDAFLRSAVANHDAERLNRPAPNGGWSVLQCFAHLASVDHAFADTVEENLGRLEQGSSNTESIRPSMVWRLFLRVLAPPVRFRAKAPAPTQPASVLDPQKVLADFVGAHDRLRSLAGRCQGLDINRKAFKHPFIPAKISVGSLYLVAASHDRRHLWQAEQTGHLQ